MAESAHVESGAFRIITAVASAVIFRFIVAFSQHVVEQKLDAEIRFWPVNYGNCPLYDAVLPA